MRKRNTVERDKVVASPAFVKLFEKAKAKMRDPKRKACTHGHAITAANAHVGDLKRTGRYTCDPCNRLAQAKYAKPATTTARKQAAVAPKKPAQRTAPSPAPVTHLRVPDDPQTALKVCLRFVDVEYSKLPDDSAARSKWARTLLGAMATNFGVHDFQVRRPVLVLDQNRAMPLLAETASA